MLPYTYTIILGWLLTLAACLPATTTATLPASSAEPPLDFNGIKSIIEPIVTAFPTPTEDDELVARQDSIPAYTPIVTPAPDQDERLASLGWRQTTYYACVTRDGTEHCGWRTPVMRNDGERIVPKGSVGGIVAVLAAWIAFANILKSKFWSETRNTIDFMLVYLESKANSQPTPHAESRVPSTVPVEEMDAPAERSTSVQHP